MIISIDPRRAPLNANASPAVQQLSLKRLHQQLAETGIRLITDESVLRLDLSGLPTKVGYDRAKAVLADVLRSLGVDACSWEPQDLAFVEEPHYYNAAAALNGFSPRIADRMQDILLDEDGGPGAVFAALDAVPDLVLRDQREIEQRRKEQADWLRENRDAEVRRQIAELEGDQSYRGFLDGPPERAPNAHPDFESGVPQYRDPFAGGW